MASAYKLRLHRWTQDKTLNHASTVLAHQIALMAEPIYELLRALRCGEVDRRLPKRPPVPEWLRLYENPRRVLLGVADETPDLLGDSEVVADLLDGSQALSVWARREPEQVRAWLEEVGRRRLRRWLEFGIRTAGRLYKRHLREIQRDLLDLSQCSAEDFEGALMRSPELYYFARVVLPCAATYRRLPAVLLRRARYGSVLAKCQAIEQLVRVDDLAVHLPAIQSWANEQPGTVRQERQRMLRQWAEQGLDYGKFSRRQVKLSLAGLLQAYLEVAGYVIDWRTGTCTWGKLNAQQIRELFDAAAQDRQGRKLGVYDEDLADLQTDSLRRMIAYQRRLWRQVLPKAPTLPNGRK